MKQRSVAYELLVTELAVVLMLMMFNQDNGLRRVGERLFQSVAPAVGQPVGELPRGDCRLASIAVV